MKQQYKKSPYKKFNEFCDELDPLFRKGFFSDETLYKNKNYDSSLIEALTYELFKLCFYPQDATIQLLDKNWQPTEICDFHGISADLKKHIDLFQQLDTTLKKKIMKLGISKNDKLTDFYEALLDPQRFLQSWKSRPLIPTWQNLDEPEKSEIGILPTCVTPQDGKTMNQKLFLFRWTLILGYSHDLYRTDAIKCLKTLRDSSIDSSLTREKAVGSNSSLQSIAPSFTKEGALKGLSEHFTQPWALDFTHADYASFLNWSEYRCSRVVKSKDKKVRRFDFMTKFIADTLGVHLLRAKYEKGWFWNSVEWQDTLKEKKNLFNLSLGKEQAKQPIKIGDKYYAFNYIEELRPEKCDELQPIIIDPNTDLHFWLLTA